MKTSEGWLTLFHGVSERTEGAPFGRYTAGAMLTALEEPARLLAVSEAPFFEAEETFEITGYAGNVVFPTGIGRDEHDPDRLLVYYGCADSRVAVATFSEREIVDSLKRIG